MVHQSTTTTSSTSTGRHHATTFHGFNPTYLAWVRNKLLPRSTDNLSQDSTLYPSQTSQSTLNQSLAIDPLRSDLQETLLSPLLAASGDKDKVLPTHQSQLDVELLTQQVQSLAVLPVHITVPVRENPFLTTSPIDDLYKDNMSTTTDRKFKVAMPPPFKGDCNQAQDFIQSCMACFKANLGLCNMKEQKITFVL